MSEGNKLAKSIYLKADLVLKSPIIIGNGIAEETDMDLLLDSEGNPFIPGSSLAGVIGSELSNRSFNKKDLELLFGRISKGENINSMIYFYDTYLKENSKMEISIRDGVKLNEETKTAKDKGKYNFQVLNTGAVFEFKVEVLIREKYADLAEFSKKIMGYIVNIIKNGELRIGAKTNRGYGKVGIKNIAISEFDFSKTEDVNKYIDFEWQNMDTNYKKVLNVDDSFDTPYTKISIPLNVKNTLFIRTYLLNNMGVDSEQITVDNKAVIPGTSWAGMVRHRALNILNEIKKESDNEKLIDNLFGYVDENNKKNISSSRIIFDESMDSQNTKLIELMRTKIDRFTGGACNTGLFASRMAVGGKHKLNIMIKDAKDYEIAIILLVIKDIENGILAIGGETNVGRGIFEKEDEVSIDKNLIGEVEFTKYMEALSKKLCL